MGNYFSHTREIMLKYIPDHVNKILEVGCGTGEFGKLVKQNRDCLYYGIEIDEYAAEKARDGLDKVITDYYNPNQQSYFNGDKFDCIVFNDVLEHMEDPYSILKNTLNLLSNNGVIVASIPNILYFNVWIKILISNDWKYTDSGTLDKTHLRFFTSNSIERMFKEAGMSIDLIEGINPSRRRLFKVINFVTLYRFNYMKYLQYACVARKK